MAKEIDIKLQINSDKDLKKIQDLITKIANLELTRVLKIVKLDICELEKKCKKL
jgi:Holliday junction resolvasome RuvABC ATP-dependent DNA helicase subunit